MKYIPHCLLVSVCLFFISCQREVDGTLTEITRGQTTDSTQLIKSIRMIYYDENSLQPGDSITEHYSYDTANHKMLVNWETSIPDDLDGVKAEYSYNDHDLLTGIVYTYPPAMTGPDLYINVAFTYDNLDVIKSLVIHKMDGSITRRDYSKTMLPAGYQLDWFVPNPDPVHAPDAIGGNERLTYDNHGNCLFYGQQGIYRDMNGNQQMTHWLTDSVTYDASGQLQKVYRKSWDDNITDYTTEQVFNYKTRESKGGELSRFRKQFLKGFANFRVEDGDDIFGFSVLDEQSEPYEFDQYSDLPVKTAEVHNILTHTQDNFSGVSTFDNLDRLVMYKGFYWDDAIYPKVFKITYYK